MNGLDRTEVACPPDVVDRLLWQDAQQIMIRHAANLRLRSCGWCGRAWPCPPRRLAERADAASRLPWYETWTTRFLGAAADTRGVPVAQNDLSDARLLPGRQATRNRRRYDSD